MEYADNTILQEKGSQMATQRLRTLDTKAQKEPTVLTYSGIFALFCNKTLTMSVQEEAGMKTPIPK